MQGLPGPPFAMGAVTLVVAQVRLEVLEIADAAPVKVSKARTKPLFLPSGFRVSGVRLRNSQQSYRDISTPTTMSDTQKNPRTLKQLCHGFLCRYLGWSTEAPPPKPANSRKL